MNDKIWQWIGDYCSGLMDKSEEQELRAWMDEAEENKLFFMEGVKMVREYQVVTRSDKNASDSLKHVREKIKARGRRQLWIQITAVASVVILFALSFAFFYMPELERESPVSAKVMPVELDYSGANFCIWKIMTILTKNSSFWRTSVCWRAWRGRKSLSARWTLVQTSRWTIST